MSEILSPPQRRPDMIGQCDSCRTIAIFAENEQEDFSGWAGYPLVKARCLVSDWCRERSQWVVLAPLYSDRGLWLKETAEGNPRADSNFSRRRMGFYFERDVLNHPPSQELIDHIDKQTEPEPKPTMRDRICDAWDWFWRRER